MLKRCSAPPENMLNMPSNVPCCLEKNAAKRAASMPGTGMNVPDAIDHECAQQKPQTLAHLSEARHVPECGCGAGGEVATVALRPRTGRRPLSTALFAPLVALMALSLMTKPW